MSNTALHNELITALKWYIDNGVTDILLDKVVDRTSVREPPKIAATKQRPTFLGKSDAYEEAVKLAKSANNLNDLKNIIAEFDGITIKKTATNMVFADGNPDSDIMIIGEAPGADEDRIGKPFVGVSGKLLDKMIKSIGLSRNSKEAKNAVYISNILNWRPPGNRTPSSAEIEISLPFIEKHIQLVQPKIILLCGSVSGKALLGRSESISRLRKKWHDYTPQTNFFSNSAKSIPALATYHPSYLLRTPLQKRAAWADMLMLQEKSNRT